jgi:glutathione S-transferase
MRAKAVEFDVTYINLREKPDWFLEVSPHGKVPVLRVDDHVLFESNAIAEYLDEVVAPRLHPEDPIKRARNRAWTDFVPTFAAALNGVTYATAADDLDEKLAGARKALDRLEDAIGRERETPGPFFNGAAFSLVDAAYAPFLQRFAIVEEVLETGLLDDYPLVAEWAAALIGDERVSGALAPEFAAEFRANLKRRGARAYDLLGAG